MEKHFFITNTDKTVQVTSELGNGNTYATGSCIDDIGYVLNGVYRGYVVSELLEAYVAIRNGWVVDVICFPDFISEPDDDKYSNQEDEAYVQASEAYGRAIMKQYKYSSIFHKFYYWLTGKIAND